MIYTTEAFNQMQEILRVFQEYISASPFFEILYSDKKGYIFLRIEQGCLEEPEELADPKELFETLLFEITSDVRDLFLCGEHKTNDLFPEEITESRKRILPYIEKMPEALQPYYTGLMEDYLQKCGEDN